MKKPEVKNLVTMSLYLDSCCIAAVVAVIPAPHPRSLFFYSVRKLLIISCSSPFKLFEHLFWIFPSIFYIVQFTYVRSILIAVLPTLN
jgi:hypothetical protein